MAELNLLWLVIYEMAGLIYLYCDAMFRRNIREAQVQVSSSYK